MKRKIIITIIYLPCCLLLSTLIICTYFKLNSHNIKDYLNGNILLNSNFHEGFKYWHCDNGVSLTSISDKLYVHLVLESQKQVRFYQEISVISGKVYRLKFNVYGKQDGAFAIYRDQRSGKEIYKWCKGETETEKQYNWDFKPEKTGKNTIYLSTNKKGDYYFSDISLIDCTINSNIQSLFLLFVLLAFSLAFVFALYFVLFGQRYFNISFLLIIAIISILPIVNINKSMKSIAENRNLSEYKSLFRNGALNYKYGIDFNVYLNDRFFGRTFYL